MLASPPGSPSSNSSRRNLDYAFPPFAVGLPSVFERAGFDVNKSRSRSGSRSGASSVRSRSSSMASGRTGLPSSKSQSSLVSKSQLSNKANASQLSLDKPSPLVSEQFNKYNQENGQEHDSVNTKTVNHSDPAIAQPTLAPALVSKTNGNEDEDFNFQNPYEAFKNPSYNEETQTVPKLNEPNQKAPQETSDQFELSDDTSVYSDYGAPVPPPHLSPLRISSQGSQSTVPQTPVRGHSRSQSRSVSGTNAGFSSPLPEPLVSNPPTPLASVPAFAPIPVITKEQQKTSTREKSPSIDDSDFPSSIHRSNENPLDFQFNDSTSELHMPYQPAESDISSSALATDPVEPVEPLKLKPMDKHRSLPPSPYAKSEGNIETMPEPAITKAPEPISQQAPNKDAVQQSVMKDLPATPTQEIESLEMPQPVAPKDKSLPPTPQAKGSLETDTKQPEMEVNTRDTENYPQPVSDISSIPQPMPHGAAPAPPGNMTTQLPMQHQPPMAPHSAPAGPAPILPGPAPQGFTPFASLDSLNAPKSAPLPMRPMSPRMLPMPPMSPQMGSPHMRPMSPQMRSMSPQVPMPQMHSPQMPMQSPQMPMQMPMQQMPMQQMRGPNFMPQPNMFNPQFAKGMPPQQQQPHAPQPHASNSDVFMQPKQRFPRGGNQVAGRGNMSPSVSSSGFDIPGMPGRKKQGNAGPVGGPMMQMPKRNARPLIGAKRPGMPMQNMPPQGMPMHQMPPQGMPMQGMPPQGMPMHPMHMPPQGMPPQGMPMQGMPPQGMPMMPPQGMPMMHPQGMPMMPQGMPPQGMPPQGMPMMPPQGLNMHGLPPQGMQQRMAIPQQTIRGPPSGQQNQMPPRGVPTVSPTESSPNTSRSQSSTATSENDDHKTNTNQLMVPDRRNSASSSIYSARNSTMKHNADPSQSSSFSFDFNHAHLTATSTAANAPVSNRVSTWYSADDSSSAKSPSKQANMTTTDSTVDLSTTATTQKTTKQCRGCLLPITGKSVRAQDGTLNGRWHRECFKCVRCDAPLGVTGEVHVHNDQPHCESCYHIANNSTCRQCGKGIEGSCLETRLDSDGDQPFLYHVNCLRCAQCSMRLQHSYFDVGGQAYCAEHAFTSLPDDKAVHKRYTQFKMI